MKLKITLYPPTGPEVYTQGVRPQPLEIVFRDENRIGFSYTDADGVKQLVTTNLPYKVENEVK